MGIGGFSLYARDSARSIRASEAADSATRSHVAVLLGTWLIVALFGEERGISRCAR